MGFILLYSAIVLLVVEIAVVLMRATGLDHDIARFQVVSLLTGAGFTTKESELIPGHPWRRRIGIFLMLFGAFSLAVVISCVSAVIAPDFRFGRLSAAALALLAVFAVFKLPWAGRLLEKRLAGSFHQTLELHELPIGDVLLLGEDDAFVDVPIGEGSPLSGTSLSRLLGSQPDVNVLLIRRGSVVIRDGRMDRPLEPGDLLYLYGSRREIESRFAHDLREKERIERDEKRMGSLP